MKTHICLLALAVASCKAGIQSGYPISTGYESSSGHEPNNANEGYGISSNPESSEHQPASNGYEYSAPAESHGNTGQGYNLLSQLSGGAENTDGGYASAGDFSGHGGQSFDLGQNMGQFSYGGHNLGGDTYIQAANDLGVQGYDAHNQQHGGGSFILQDGGHEYGGNDIQQLSGQSGYDDGFSGHNDYGNTGGYENYGHAEAVGEHTDTQSPVAVPLYKHITVPVPKIIHINVPKPILIGVPQPYPVKVPVHKPVAVPVETEVKIPIEKLVPYPIVKHVPYPVEKRVPYKVEKTVTIHVPHPYPVKIPVYKTIHHKSHY